MSDIMTNSVTTVEDRKEVDDAAVQQAVEEVAAVAHQQDVIRIAHALSHDISHGEPVSIFFCCLINVTSELQIFFSRIQSEEKYTAEKMVKAHISLLLLLEWL